MDQETLYRKTAAGVDAIATRHAALVPRERALLILVDGKRTAGELAALGVGSADAEAVLGTLLAQGFIEAVTVRSSSTAAPKPASEQGMPLAKARTLAVRRLNDLLGPSATDLCMRLEATHTPQEFRTAVRRAEAALREVVGPQRAAQFLSEIENPRPN